MSISRTSAPAPRSSAARSRKSPRAPMRRADEEPAPGVLAGVGPLAGREDVLLGDEAVDAPVAVDERQLLDPVGEHPLLRLLDRDVRRPRHEPRGRRHELLHRPLVLDRAPREVPVREEPRQDPVSRRLLDQQAGDVVTARQLPRLADAAPARQAERPLDDVAVGALDPRHLGRLRRDRQPAVHEAHPALERDRHRHPGVGHAVHVGGDHRKVEPHLTRQARPERDLTPRGERARLGAEEEVVVRPADELGLEHAAHVCLRPRRVDAGTVGHGHPLPSEGSLG